MYRQGQARLARVLSNDPKNWARRGLSPKPTPLDIPRLAELRIRSCAEVHVEPQRWPGMRELAPFGASACESGRRSSGFFPPVTLKDAATGKDVALVDGGVVSAYPVFLFDKE
jgi:hypothetical protein